MQADAVFRTSNVSMTGMRLLLSFAYLLPGLCSSPVTRALPGAGTGEAFGCHFWLPFLALCMQFPQLAVGLAACHPPRGLVWGCAARGLLSLHLCIMLLDATRHAYTALFRYQFLVFNHASLIMCLGVYLQIQHKAMQRVFGQLP